MQKKNIIFLSISLVLIILLGIGVSYSMWNISVSQDTNNTAYTECFDLSITNKENNINLDNAYPISNDKGKSLTPYTFTVTNTCDITTQYSVNLEVLNNSTLSSKFIDVMVEGNINLLSSYGPTDKVNTSSIESRKLTTGILKSQESKNYSLRLWLDYNTTLEDLNNEIKTFKSKIVVVGKPINYTGDTVFNFDYTGSEQTFTAPVSGTYKLETWGAKGVDNGNGLIGGLGGYASGNINLNEAKNLYIYVGGVGQINVSNNQDLSDNYINEYFGSVAGGYNGGGASGTQSIYSTSGGGATDIRINNGAWNNFNSLKSRIIIAAGGGGSSYHDGFVGQGGAGGGLIGQNGQSTKDPDTRYSGGGTQTKYGYAGEVDFLGSFGSGGTGYLKKSPKILKIDGGGGSGYYGGSAGDDWGAGGAGGSSFISGHNGCDAIKEESTEDNIIHTGQSIHYSGLYFTDTVMIDGEGYKWTDKKEEQIGMPSHSDNSIIMGNSGNGYARITLISID